MGAIKGYLTAALPMAAAGASVSGKGAPQGSGVTVPVGQRQILPQVGCCGGERKELVLPQESWILAPTVALKQPQGLQQALLLWASVSLSVNWKH